MKKHKKTFILIAVFIATIGIIAPNNATWIFKSPTEILTSTLPPGTSKEKAEAWFKKEKFKTSKNHKPDSKNSGFFSRVKLSDNWNQNNYFVDYSKLNKSNNDHYFHVRVLYDGQTDEILEMYIDKFEPKTPPMFLLKD